MKKLLSFFLVLASTQVFFTSQAFATSERHSIYVGTGSVDSGDPNKSDHTPWSLGYFVSGTNNFFGIDIAGEGTSLNNTSGKVNVVEQAFSMNLIAGRNLYIGNNWRAGLGVLVGFRDTGKSCPDSYLGYECYADQKPKTEHDINYGTILHLKFKQALVGIRASGESTQMILGVAF